MKRNASSSLLLPPHMVLTERTDNEVTNLYEVCEYLHYCNDIIVTSSFILAEGCPTLTITNGMVTYDPTETPPLVGATATYSCNSGYILDGNAMRTCEDVNNGTWTGMDPQCNREYSI